MGYTASGCAEQMEAPEPRGAGEVRQIPPRATPEADSLVRIIQWTQLETGSPVQDAVL